MVKNKDKMEQKKEIIIRYDKLSIKTNTCWIFINYAGRRLEITLITITNVI